MNFFGIIYAMNSDSTTSKEALHFFSEIEKQTDVTLLEEKNVRKGFSTRFYRIYDNNQPDDVIKEEFLNIQGLGAIHVDEKFSYIAIKPNFWTIIEVRIKKGETQVLVRKIWF